MVSYGETAGMESLSKSHDGRSVHPGLPPLEKTTILFLQIKIYE